MNALELAPYNIGSQNKRYDYVAGCLIAFACRESFKLNTNYKGFLINGERPINYELALIFGKLFNQNPMLWIELQAKNEIKKLMTAQGSKYHDYSLNDLLTDN